jgi:hypothetical protein
MRRRPRGGGGGAVEASETRMPHTPPYDMSRHSDADLLGIIVSENQNLALRGGGARGKGTPGQTTRRCARREAAHHRSGGGKSSNDGGMGGNSSGPRRDRAACCRNRGQLVGATVK